MNLDDIIPLLGNFGRYQLFMLCYMGLVSIFNSITTLSNVFYAAGSDHWCSVLPAENCSSWAEFQGNCTDVKKSIFLPPPEKNTSRYPYSNCYQWDLPAGYVFDPYKPLTDYDDFNYTKVQCQNGWDYDTSQYKTTIISEFNLVCDDSSLPSLAQSIYFVGFLVGSLFFGTVSDWVGRRTSLIIGALLWFAGFLATTFSINIYMYTAFRFITAFGSIGTYISSYVLALEIVGTSWRTTVTMVAGILFAVGYFILATAAMFVREWKTLSLIMSLLSGLLLIPLPVIQESVKWLLSKGKIAEAEAIVRRLARFNNKTLPEDLFDKYDVKEHIERQKSVVPPSVIDLYRTPNMAAKTLNLQFNWMVNNLVYYGLSQSTGDLGVNVYWAFFISGAVEIPAMLYALYAVERFGRKCNTSLLELIGGVACLSTLFIPVGVGRTVVAMVGKFCISATFSIIYLYTTELFPTSVRAVGIGVCSVASRLGAILSPVILLLGDTLASLPLILFGSSAVVAGVLVLLLPETRGQKLPQTLAEAEEIGKCHCFGRDAYDVSAVNVDVDKEGAIAESSPDVDLVGDTKFMLVKGGEK